MKPCLPCKVRKVHKVHSQAHTPYTLGRWFCLLLLLAVVAPVADAASAPVGDSKLWLTIAQRAEETRPQHYARVATYITAQRSDTVTDEVWRDGAGRWRLERQSDTWDNGLVAVSDGKSIIVSVPYMPTLLRVQAQSLCFAGTARSCVGPGIFLDATTTAGFAIVGEAKLGNRTAVEVVRYADGVEIHRWIDKESGLPVREEYIRSQQPLLRVSRHELPIESVSFKLTGDGYLTDQRTWQHQAIVRWLAANFPTPPPIATKFPDEFRIELVQPLQTPTGQQVLFLVSADGELISVWLTMAEDSKSVKRPLLTKGSTVVTRRIGRYELVAVAATERIAAQALATFVGK